MDLCRELRIRYLWVDTLCIVQDDVQSKKLYLNNMDCIYHLACLTIVSAAGDDATAGLPAYKFERASLNRSFSARGLHLYQWKNSWSELDLCLPTWHTRGWTYQEMVLSTRMLFFTADTVFCISPGSTSFYDPMSARLLSKSCVDLTLSPSNHSLKPSQVTASSAMGTFVGALEVYASRQLSQDSDNINAFQGILQVLEPVLGPTWHGLFLTNFASYLHHSSWATIPVRVPQFPSWSWAGWKLDRTGISISQVASSAPVFRVAYNGKPGPIDTYTTEQKDFLRQMDTLVPYPRTSFREFQTMTSSRVPNLIGFWAWEVKLWVSPPGERNNHAVSVTQDDRPYLAEHHHSVWQIRLEQRWAGKTMTPGRYSFIVFAVTQPYKLVHPMMVEWVEGIAYRANFVSPRSFVTMEEWMKLKPARKFVVMG